MLFTVQNGIRAEMKNFASQPIVVAIGLAIADV